MSRRAEIEQRLRRLGDISGILSAMKTLALIETHKFGRFMEHQERLLASLEAASRDFLHFHPKFHGEEPADGGQICVLIGSERGFCGDFNEAVVTTLATMPSPLPRLITVGRRLAARMETHPALAAWLEGPNVAEEVQPVLDRLMRELHRLQQTETGSWSRLSVLAHGANGVSMHPVLPLTPSVVSNFSPPGFPPRLYVSPTQFFADMTEHYLFARLPGLFHASLLAENRRRLEHMDHALHRLEARANSLTRKRNALRQEEITEEIEVILLSVESLLGGEGRSSP